MVATLGETTGVCALRSMRDQMMRSAEGRDILRERPLITAESVNVDKVCCRSVQSLQPLSFILKVKSVLTTLAHLLRNKDVQFSIMIVHIAHACGS